MNPKLRLPRPRPNRLTCAWVLAITLGWLIELHAASPRTFAPDRPAALQRLANDIVRDTQLRFAGEQLSTNQFAFTLVDLRTPEKPALAGYRGDVPIYPASVIKLFYLVATHQWLEDGRLQETDELQRALHDMIVDSYNEATHYVVDLLTGTTSGPELPGEELRVWFDKRNAVNRYFTSLGYSNINASKKPWCEGPYGREMQAIKAYDPKRNALTTDATARLMMEIVTRQAVAPARCEAMMKLLRRDPFADTKDPDDQAKFSGPGLPAGARLWSKAGWTSDTRHDAIYVELPDGGRFVLVTFTTDHANNREILPHFARSVVRGLSTRP